MNRWKSTRNAPPVLLESEEQANFFAEVSYRYRTREDFSPLLLFATFNGEVWSSFRKVMRAGLTPGVSDILYLQPRGGYPYFSCELKSTDRETTKDGGVTPAEKAWLQAARDEGAFVCVCYGCDHVLEKFSEYMAMPSRDHNTAGSHITP